MSHHESVWSERAAAAEARVEQLEAQVAQAERTLERVRALPRNWQSIRCGVRSPGLRAAAESLRIALRGAAP